MKIGDLVTTKSRRIIGIIIESKTHRQRAAHHVQWSSPKVKKNPVWVDEHYLETVSENR